MTDGTGGWYPITAGEPKPAEFTSVGGVGPIDAVGYKTGDGPMGGLPGAPVHTVM